MKPQLLILCLACSVLLGSPEIARGNSIEIDNDYGGVYIDTSDEIRVDTGRIQISVPERRQRDYRSPYSIEPPRWNVPNSRSYCHGSSRVYQRSHQTSRSTGNGSRVYSSTSTQVCE